MVKPPEWKLDLRQEVARLTGREVLAAEFYSTESSMRGVANTSVLGLLARFARAISKGSTAHPRQVVVAAGRDWVSIFLSVKEGNRYHCGERLRDWTVRDLAGVPTLARLGVDLTDVATDERWRLIPRDLSPDAALIRSRLTAA